MGAWIETDDIQILHRGAESHPTWVRGLKLYSERDEFEEMSRTLRGCVD